MSQLCSSSIHTVQKNKKDNTYQQNNMTTAVYQRSWLGLGKKAARLTLGTRTTWLIKFRKTSRFRLKWLPYLCTFSYEHTDT